jgi:hypothetical protein
LRTVGTLLRMSTATAWLLTLGAIAAPAAAPAQGESEPIEPLFTAAEASAELDEAVAALSTTDPAAAHPTDELRDLTAALPSLAGADRRRARGILARPPANEGQRREPFGAEWPNSSDEETLETDNFIVHLPEGLSCSAPAQGCDEPDLTDASGSSAPDYIDQVAGAAEESFDVENGDLGWPAPKPDGNRGGNGKIDVYVADICDETGGACIFGYANTDDPSSQCRRPPFRCFAYLVLDNDYSGTDGPDPDSAGDEFGYDDPGVPLRVTTAHEYNHILQFRLDTRQDGWMFESTAVWSEEQVFPDDDDWLAYLGVWKRTSRKPITSFGAGGGLRVYGSAVWNHWLELGANHGPDVILDAWKSSHKTDPKHFAVAAYNRAIRRNGGQGFSQAFGRFAAATAEWQVLDGDFPGPDANQPDESQLPKVKRKGRLRRGGRAQRFALDHTAYWLMNVRAGSANRLKLRVKAPRGVRTAIALVGREGGLSAGDIRANREFARRGGKLTVRLGDVRDDARLTAVIVNADGGLRAGSQRYARNNERFRVSLHRATRRSRGAP